MKSNLVRNAMFTAAILFAVSVCLPAWAQAPVHDVYLLSTFENNNNSARFDQPVRIVNPGLSLLEADTAVAVVDTICANIYVFDTQQQLLECCSCAITANGLLTVTLSQLTDKSLNALPINAGVIKIVATTRSGQNPVCNAASPNTVVPTLRAWMSHFESANTSLLIPTVTPFINVQAFDRSDLSSAERNYLLEACQFAQYLGSGVSGRCRCPAGG